MTPYVKFLFFTVPSYSYFLAVGTLIAAGIAVYVQRKHSKELGRGRIVDVCLAALVCAVIGARIGHVLLNTEYFAAHPDEMTRLNAGGLNWHGALLGGLIGTFGMAWLRKVPLLPLLDAFAPGLPVVAWGGWAACGANACGYGAEVDNLANYPAFLVAERADIYGLVLPRYDTQQIGSYLALGILIIALFLTWRGLFTGYRFWLILGLFSAGMFFLGFLRGDAAIRVGNLRLDQWLDLGFMLGAVMAALITRYRKTLPKGANDVRTDP